MNTLTRRSSLIDSIPSAVVPLPRSRPAPARTSAAGQKEWTIWAQHARRVEAAQRRAAGRRTAERRAA